MDGRREFFSKLGKTLVDLGRGNLDSLNPDEKVKLLTKDGKLVEIPRETLLSASKQKATSHQVETWIQTKESHEKR